MMTWFKRLTFLSLFLLVAGFAVAESIEGIVKDNTGGVIPGVSVTLTSTETGAVRQAVTDDRGFYIFNAIRPGAYELKAELEGFQPQKISGIKLSVGDALNFAITLAVSEVTTEVEVKAQVEQVETTTSQIDNVIDEKRITDLPLNGRDPLSLMLLTPGVVNSPAGYAANGARNRGNNYQLDGVDNNYTQTSGTTVDVNVDSTAEFRVVTSNPSAEYGRAGGAIVDVITKSGTNQFHGSAFYYIRAENLDASTWAENFYDTGKGDYKRHEYGGSVGGPVLKDKLFFFFNVDRTKTMRTGIVTCSVPTADWKATVVNQDMAAIFNTYYPLPNTGVDVVAGVSQQYTYVRPAITTFDQYNWKVDYNLSTAHTISGRYTLNQGANPFVNSGGGGDLPASRTTRAYSGRNQLYGVDWTWIVNPSMVNSFKIGYTRARNTWIREWRDYDLSFAGYWADSLRYFTDFGGPAGYGDEKSFGNTYQFKDTFTWTKGTHNLRFGLDMRFNQNIGGSGFGMVPAAYFDPTYYDGTTVNNIRNGLVDNVNQQVYSDGVTYDVTKSDWRGWRQHEFDYFVQDDWKIRPNLTLNLGLRFEFKPAAFEVNNLATKVENPAQGYSIVNKANFFDPANWLNGDWHNNTLGAAGVSRWVGNGNTIVLCGPDTGNEMYDAQKYNWAPRAGFSWDPWGDGKTAIRGGYGISFDRNFGNLLTWNAAQAPYGQAGWLDARSGAYSGVYPNNFSFWGRGIAMPTPQLVFDPYQRYEMVLFTNDWKTPYIQTWNVSAQRELWAGNILNVSWVGSSGVHLLVRNDPNQPAHPSAELIAAMQANGISMTNIPAYVRNFTLQNTQFGKIHHIDTYGHSNYNALQTTFSHRYQNGLQFQVNYTWSKAFDQNSEAIFTENGSSPFASDYYNMAYDRGYASMDVRHNMTANFIYELPFGPGKILGGNTSGILAAIIGGWQVNGIFSANTGFPLDYKVARDTLGTGYTNARAPSRPYIASTEFVVDYPNNYVGPRASNFRFSTADINVLNPQGDYYRGFFRTPGFWNVDFSLFKEVKTPWFTSEGATIQIRAEAFNLFNHTNWGSPNITLASGNLGKTWTVNANRQIQFGLRFVF